MAGAALCELSSADFVAGAALCEPSSADRRQDRESRITSPGERGRRRTILLETAFEKAVGNSIGKHESRNESRITLLEVLVETAFERLFSREHQLGSTNHESRITKQITNHAAGGRLPDHAAGGFSYNCLRKGCLIGKINWEARIMNHESRNESRITKRITNHAAGGRLPDHHSPQQPALRTNHCSCVPGPTRSVDEQWRHELEHGLWASSISARTASNRQGFVF